MHHLKNVPVASQLSLALKKGSAVNSNEVCLLVKRNANQLHSTQSMIIMIMYFKSIRFIVLVAREALESVGMWANCAFLFLQLCFDSELEFPNL